MLRTASSSVGRTLLKSSWRRAAPALSSQTLSFHASTRKEEEEAPVATAPKPSGLFGTGLPEMFALPIGITAAIPAIHFEWYVVNEETQLAAVFIAFCVTVYTQAGDAIYASLDEKSQTILKEQSEVEEKVISALEEKLEFLKENSNLVQYFEGIHQLRKESYDRLNAAGAIKPQHDFKAQVERLLGMIAAEETSVRDKKSKALLEEATQSVTDSFRTEKALKKAALDVAIANIKGTAVAGKDPVKDAFVSFFQQKAKDLKKTDDGSEEKATRAELVAKMNNVAKNEGFFFEFGDDGKVKMRA